jgi:hypothetical protein
MRSHRSSYLRSVRGLVAAGLRGFGRLFRASPEPAAARRRKGLADLMPLEDRRLPSAIPVGAEFRVNTYTPDTQQNSPATRRNVALDAAGDFVATWASHNQDGSGWGVYAQRFDSSGNPVGGEFLVNVTTTKDQTDPTVAMDSAGNFVIAWTSNQGAAADIYARRYDASGTPQTGEFLVNAVSAKAHVTPVIAMDPAGAFVVAWSSQSQDGSGWGVFAQRFDASGNAQGGEFQVNTYTQDDQTNPAVATDASGNFVVAWQSHNQDGSGWGVYAQRFNAAGNPVGGEFRVNSYTQDDQDSPSVAVESNGNFLVAWESHNQDGDSWGIYAQRYDAAGNPQGAEFRVNTTTAKEQQFPSVAVDGSGNFIATWQSHEQDGDGWGVYAQQYDAAGSPVGGEFRVNTTTAGDQQYASVAADGRGDFVVTWSGAGPGDGSGVFAQRYATASIDVSPTSGLVTLSGGSAAFNVVLGTQPTANVTIGIHSSDTSQGTVSVSSLTFTPSNWNTPQTVMVTGVNNPLVSGNQPYTVITDPAISADPNYNGLDAPDVSLTNDSTSAPGVIVMPTAGLTTTEAGGTAAFGVRLATAPLILSSVTVTFASSDPTAGVVSTPPLTFTWLDWNTPQLVQVTGVDDQIVTGDRTYTITGQTSTLLALGYSGLTTPPVTITNLETDVASVQVTPTSGLTTTESGGQATFQVQLTSKPTADVTVPLSSSNPGQGVANVSSLTFTSSNWNTPQTVTVTGVDDHIVNGDQAYQIVVGPAVSADPNYDGYNGPNVQLTNLERDTAGITVQQDVGPSGPEFQVNTTTAGDQQTAPSGHAVAADGSGNFVVTWASQGQDGSGWGVYAQRYNAAGNPVGSEFRVNTTTAGDQTNPAVAMDSAGDFVIAWQSQGQDGSGWGIYAQRYDNAGNPVGGEFRVNTTTALDQTNPSLAVSPGGSFLVAWQSATGSSSKSDILAQRYDNAGNPVGGEFRVNSLTSQDEQTPAVAAYGPGDYLIAWHSQNPGTQQNAIYAQRYNAAGGALGGQTLVSPSGATVQAPSVDTDAAGDSVIAWQGQDGSGWGAFAQRYDPSGNPVGGAFRVNTTTAGDQTNPAVAMDAAGNFLISWSSFNQDALGSWGVYGQRYDAAGNPVSGEFRVNSTTAGDQVNSAVAAGGTGQFVAVWSSQGQDGSGFGVYSQRYNASGSPTSGLLTTEAGTATTFSVALTSQPVAPVTVTLTNPRPTEGALSAPSLTFTAANWNVPQVVTVTGVLNVVVDGDQTYTIALSAGSADPVYNGMSGPAVRVTNQDVTLPWVDVTPTSGLVTSESGGSATFTVRLSSQPSADVTIGLASSNPGAGVPSVSSLTFTPANWNQPQTVTVTGVDDFVVTGDTAYTIVTAPAVSTDPAYNGLDPADVTLVNRETDRAGITVTPVSGPVSAQGPPAAFGIVLTSKPTADVTIPLSSSDPAVGVVSQASVTFTPADWNVAQAVSVGAGASPAPGTSTFTVVTGAAVSADSGYSGIDAADVTVTRIEAVPPPAGSPGSPPGGSLPGPVSNPTGGLPGGNTVGQVQQTLTQTDPGSLVVTGLPGGIGGTAGQGSAGSVDLINVVSAPAAGGPAPSSTLAVALTAVPQPAFTGASLSGGAAGGAFPASAVTAGNQAVPPPNSALSFFLSSLPRSGASSALTSAAGVSAVQDDTPPVRSRSASELPLDLRQDGLFARRPENNALASVRSPEVALTLPDSAAARSEEDETATETSGAGGFARRAARAWASPAWEGPDGVEDLVEAIDPAAEAGPVAVTGLAATAGYVLLNTRAGSWLLGVLAARPLWRQFDPLEVLFAWEEEQDGRGDDEEEALLSLVE